MHNRLGTSTGRFVTSIGRFANGTSSFDSAVEGRCWMSYKFRGLSIQPPKVDVVCHNNSLICRIQPSKVDVGCHQKSAICRLGRRRSMLDAISSPGSVDSAVEGRCWMPYKFSDLSTHPSKVDSGCHKNSVASVVCCATTN